MTLTEYTYYPGCSLATTAREANEAVIRSCLKSGIRLIESEDWNCCGSSAAHSIDSRLAVDLAARNLMIAPPERPLMIGCPNCFLKLREAQIKLTKNEALRKGAEKRWGRRFNENLVLTPFLEFLTRLDYSTVNRSTIKPIRFAPYYGCMLNRPPAMMKDPSCYGTIEKVMGRFNADAVQWPFAKLCCGSFLSVVKPKIVTPMVDKIMAGAIRSGAECIVTACAMCQLNLEIRCHPKRAIPVFHIAEIIALFMNEATSLRNFKSHLIDPAPFFSEHFQMG